jgi:hypothetical protein
MEEYIVFSNITSNNINNNHITLQNFYNNPLLNPKYTWINNPTTGMFNSESNIIEFNIENIPRLILKENEMLLSNLIANNLIGSGYNISNIYLSNIVNIPQLILSNVLSDVLSYYVSSNNLQDQKYINSNSIQDILEFLISSNILSKQNYINSNSIQDITSFLISSNTLKDQNYINSNSIEDITSFLISSNILSKQNYINSNSIEDLLNFLITSNNLKYQNYINSNSIQDIISFLISSNTLKDQNYINSNSIEDILSFLISSNTLKDQNYINSNSIQDNELLYITSNILSKQNYMSSNFIFSYISSNNLKDQNYINSNSAQDITSFLISSNLLSKQNFINSNSIQDIVSFFITSNNIKDQEYINSNSIQDIASFLISSNILSKQNYINSNSIQDIISFLISSNLLSKQNLINSNSIEDIVSFFITSNNIKDQEYINSNSIQDIISFLISSNNLQDQQYINSNSIQDIVSFLISSNNLQDQKYINSNSIQDIVSFLISSNVLSKQNYINSNSIQDITKFLISSNILSIQNYINSNSIQDIFSFLLSSNNLQDQCYINSNSIQDIVSFLISSNILSKQNYINSNSIKDLLDFYISSNNLKDQKYINSNSITDIVSFLISSNTLQDQKYINSNSITDIASFLISSNNLQDQNYINSNSITDIVSFLISSNNLQDQNYINSNSITDILKFLISSNILSKQNYINSNSITDISKFLISSNILSKQNYINSNSIQDIISFLISSNNLQDQNYINSNSITDIVSFLISSNNLQDQKYINSNSITDIVSFLISSNNLQDQKYINSNSITDIVSFLISSNTLKDQNYINSNSITDIVSFLISSNNLQDQNYINSNSITDIFSFLISSNNLQDQKYINSNSIQDLLSFFISSNILSKQNYINSNSITDIYDFYVASNSVNYFILNNNFGNNTSFTDILSSYFNYVTQNTDIIAEGIHNKFIIDNVYNNSLYVDGTITASNLFVLGANTILNTTSYQTSELQIINNNPYPSLIVDQTGISKDNLNIINNGSNILLISSNGNVGIGVINPKNTLEVNGDIIASNIIGSGSNIKDINWCNLINIPTYFITSNILESQLYINSNSVQDVISFYVGSNVITPVMLNNGFINSNNIFTLTSNLGFDTITQRNAAIKSLTYNYPLYKTSSSTILNYNPLHMMLNSNNSLTLSSNIRVVDNTLTFKFNLLQGNITYPNLWYYQFKIKDYSKCYLIDGKEYNAFTLTSWSENNVDVLYNSFITVTNNQKEIVNNNIVNNNLIYLDDGTLTTEGWQLDNDTEYMTWFSTTPKTIYNILIDQINSSSNITNYNYIDSNILSLQNYINSNYLLDNIKSLITCNILSDILLPYYNVVNNTTDNINNGINNKFIVNTIYDNNLNIDGTITASNLYVLGINTVFTNNFTNPINNLSIENFNTGTALIVDQLTTDVDIANFYNNNDIILSISGNSNIGIKTLNPNYKLEVIGTVNATEIYGIGSNISNIIWSNIINIDPSYVSSNSLLNNLSFIVTPNDLLNYLKQGYINDINIILNLNTNYGFDTVSQMNNDINYLNSKVDYINNDILSNVIYYNNILQNNYGLIEDNSYSLSNVNFNISNKNTFFYFNSNIYLPNSINEGNYNVDFFNGKNIIYNYNNININYSTVYPILYDTDNTVLNPKVFYQFDGNLNDVSGNNNNLIGYNNIGFSSNSIYGLSLNFISSNLNYAKMISSNSINISTIQNSYGFTISFWVLIKPTTGNGSTIFEIRDNTYPLNYLYINYIFGNLGSGVLRFGTNLDPIFAKVGMFSGFGDPYSIYYDTFYNIKNYNDSKYHHIIWQIDNTGSWNIWVDNIQLIGNNIPTRGNVVTTYGSYYAFPVISEYYSIMGFEFPLNINTTYSYTFGNNFYLNNSGGYFDGNIVDFRIYNSIITSNQITTLYNNPISYSTYNNYLTNSLIGWYKFQNNLNDSSGNNNNIVGIGTIRYSSTAGIINGPTCLYLNKDIWTADNYISIPPSIINLPNIQRTTGITISFWVSTNQWQRNIIEMSTDFAMLTDYNYSNWYYVRFIFKNNTISLPLTSINFLDGKNHFICYTVDNTGTWNLWMDNIKLIGNGGLLGNVTSLNLTTNSYFYIGKSIGYGNISDLRIYPLVLSDEYIYKLHYYIEYNSPLNITSTLSTKNKNIYYADSTYPILFDYNNIIIQPLLWLKFDNILKTYNLYNVPVFDSSIYNNTTGNVGKVHYSSFGIKGNNSFFLGNNRYLTYNNISLLKMSFSISFWSFIWTISAANIIIIGDVNNSYQRITFGINSTNNYVFDFTNDGFNSSATCTNDFHTWVHLTITYNPNTNIRKIYRNGVLIGYNIANGIPFPSAVFNIGKDQVNGTYWSGAIDDFRIYNIELQEYQVKNLYTGKINFYHYANDGPLYTNTLTNNIGINTKNPPNTVQVNGTIKANEFSGYGSNINNINWSNIINIPTSVQNVLTSIAISSNVLFNQPYANNYNVSANYLSSNYFTTMNYINSNNMTSLINSYNNLIINTNYITSNSLNNYVNDSTLSLLQNNYSTVIDNYYVSNINFVVNKDNNTYNSNSQRLNNNSYLYFNDEKLNITNIINHGLYKLKYENGNSILYYNTYSNIIPYLSDTVLEITPKNLLSTTDKNYSNIYDSSNNIIYPRTWYKFDNNNVITYDSTPYSHATISITNSSFSSNSIKGYTSLYLGGNSYGILWRGYTLDTSSFSVMFWIYQPRTNLVFSCLSSQNITVMGSTANSYYFTVNSGYGRTTTSYPLLQNDIGKWVHMTYVFDNNLKYGYIYRNGSNIAKMYMPITTLIDDLLYLGSTSPSSCLFNLDDYRLYSNVVLTSNQILSCINATYYDSSTDIFITSNNSYPNAYNGITSNILNPLSWYKFEDLNNIQLFNNPTLSQNSVKGNNCLLLNGTDQYLTDTLSYNLFNSDFSISFWTKPLNNSDMYIYNIANSYFGIKNNNYYLNFNGTEILTSFDITNDVNTWIYIIITYNLATNTIIIYRNNNIIITSNPSNSITTNNILTIGKYNNNYWNGYIDDFRIYNITLSELQIKELYAGRITYYHYYNNGPLYINNITNNIGINVINPLYTLQVNGNTNATEFIGIGSNITNITWNNILFPSYIKNNIITSNNLHEQNYINSNSIQNLLDFYISSNILSKQNYINSNSITDLLSLLISSNVLQEQNYINSNSIIDLLDFYISSNILQKQNYINSNSLKDITSFLISSNTLQDQNYINSNSITDIISFLISSNTLQDQNYINSNSIEDLLLFLISSNTLQDQNYINSKSIQDITNFLISSNILQKQNYINSNSIIDLLDFYISSNIISKQSYVNSNSITNLLDFYISSNILSKQIYINSNSIIDLLDFYLSSNILNNIYNSNSIQDILDFYISSNILSKQDYINSNSITDLLDLYISSNILSKQNYVNSNSITDLLNYYISSNVLQDQQYINSNSITDLLDFYISSNVLQEQNYINSNSIENIISFYVSSNTIINNNLVSITSIDNVNNIIGYLSNVLTTINNKIDIINTKLYNNNIF